MPTLAIYRDNKPIWHKQFDPPENGRIELDKPVGLEKGDFVAFYDWHKSPTPTGHEVTKKCRFTTIYYDMKPEPEEVESIEVDIEFPKGVFKYD